MDLSWVQMKEALEQENYLCFPYLFIFNTLKPIFYWHKEEPWQIIITSSTCIPVLKLWFLISLSFIATSTNGALLPCPLSLLFNYPSSSTSYPFIFLMSFLFWLSFQMTLDLLCDCSPNSIPPHHLPTRDAAQVQPHPVPVELLSGRSRTQWWLWGHLGRTNVLDFLSEAMCRRPCCYSLCLISHEWRPELWLDFADTNM